jgi:pyridoxamine 5'-phosphate oxidase
VHFAWLPQDRQVIINGAVEPLSKAENLKYFLSRPRESQLAALASHQSHPITARRVLEEKFRELKAKYQHGDISLPSFWGGFRVVPEHIEFWQGGEHRLHDRFLYTAAEQGWQIQRLSP